MDPDQDHQRNDGNVVGDSTSMTIEFLQARLLAERSVSRTSRQRADELVKRVVELEEQLRIVSLQRKKAEKATADVLAILENHGVNDFSEEFDSSSDQESNHFESKMGTNFPEEESSAGSKMERNHTDDSRCSETSSLPGRSLSWKSGKDSPSSGGKKLIDCSSKKQSPFSSPSLASLRRSAGGKSYCRIRQRETRSAVEEHTNACTQAPQENGDAACAEGCPTSSGCATEIPVNSSVKQNLSIVVEGSEDLEGKQPDAPLSSHLHNRDREMERALEDQAQLIGQYEDEEAAQREWEEKFRENNSSPVSCERGTTQSDITEEIDEIKANSAPYPVRSNGSIDFETKSNVKNVLITEQSSSASKLSGHEPSPPLQPDVDREKPSTISHDTMPREGPEKLGSVLESLQQAKLSLNHKLKASPPLNSGSVRKAIEFPSKDRPDVPIGCGGLYKVPSDFYVENTTQNNTLLALNPRYSLSNYYPDERTALNSANRFITRRSSETWPRSPSIQPPLLSSLDAGLSHPNNFTYSGLNINGGVRDVPFPSPYVYNSRSMEMDNVFSSYASPTFPLYTDPILRMPYGGEQPLSSTDINRVPLRTPYGEERLLSSTDMNHVRSSYASSLTYGVDPMVQIPFSGERGFSSTETGVGGADLSFYNHIRPNMYR